MGPRRGGLPGAGAPERAQGTGAARMALRVLGASPFGRMPRLPGGVRRPRRGAPEQHSEGAAEVGGPRRQGGKRRRGAVTGHGNGGREQWQGEATAERAPARWWGVLRHGTEGEEERGGGEHGGGAHIGRRDGAAVLGGVDGDVDEEEEGRRG